MISIITGDVINSRKSKPKLWLKVLKTTLNKYGKEPRQWEIFRGDSFQLETKPEQALEAAILIKATLKQFKEIDVRLAIGIGDKTYASKRLTESNGSAFVNSGECFEQLKKTTLAIKSPFESFDTKMNIMFELALLTMDSWTPTSSTIIKASLENAILNQKQIAELLGKSQSNISEGLKRGGFEEVLKLLNYYKAQIKILC
ncbi:hypothetical protein MNBD_BACTEROID02-714 [hydrothermal vent metagenome]|uniref:Uncharacterized protein n=1 Tax=hydrothermal vent metagenome TaxID=652676 RepID=A0A3B0QRK6_9ZZZZ